HPAGATSKRSRAPSVLQMQAESAKIRLLPRGRGEFFAGGAWQTDRRSRGCFSSAPFASAVRSERDAQAEGRAVTQAGFERQRPAVFSHDLAADGQTEARSV